MLRSVALAVAGVLLISCQPQPSRETTPVYVRNSAESTTKSFIWGRSTASTTSVDRTPTSQNGPAPSASAVEGGRAIEQVSVGTTLLCTRSQGEVECGSNERQLHRIDLPLAATDVSAGLDHACAVLVDGSVHCWGNDNRGQLGGRIVPIPPVTMLEAGEATTCAGDGSHTWCWGWQWGAPRQVTDSHGVWLWGGHHGYCYTNSHVRCWGAGWSKHGFDLSSFDDTPQVVELPGWSPVVGMGYYSQCALVDGRPWCWGLNSRIGGKGDGRLVPGNTEAVVRTPQLVDGIEGATEIAGGEDFMCAVVPAGVVCWSASQAPRRVLEGEWSSISAGSSRACALNNGRLYCW